jgi:membrane associated rhomboid family serine protease
MAWRNEWEEGREEPRGPGWRATLAVAPVTGVLFVGSVVATLLAIFGSNGVLPFRISDWLGLSLDHAPWVFPFFTYVLPHDAAQPMHLIFNMLVLWFFGRELEQRLGRGPFATLFFGAALTGAIAHLCLSAAMGDVANLIGASGGLFGLIFFLARESPDRQILFYFFRLPMKVVAVLLVVLDVHPLLLGDFADGVAHLCHLGGALFGFLWFRHRFDAFSWWPALRAARQSGRARAAADRERGDDAEMDRLLAKIHAVGLPRLTDRERRFLQERSDSLKGGRR